MNGSEEKPLMRAVDDAGAGFRDGRSAEDADASALHAAKPSRDSRSSKGADGGRAEAGHRIIVARRVTLSLVFVAVVASLAFDCGLGTPSTFGVGQFFLLCPLGGLEAMIADRSFIPVAAISVAVVCALALLFGRAWCAWGCPAPAIRRFFKRDPEAAKPSEKHVPVLDSHSQQNGGACGGLATSAVAEEEACDGEAFSPSGKSGCAAVAQARTFATGLRHVGRDTRTWALVIVLVVTFVAGLPLFCLVCPIGLTFGSVASLWHLFVDKQVTISVVVFPAALAIELVLYRKWCMNLCPIAGLLGIFGQFAVLFRPKVAAQSCLACAGKNCAECLKACPEHIDLHAPDAELQLGECTRCGECARACPTKSISMK